MAGLDDTCYYKCSLGLITIIHCLCSLFLSLLLTHCIAHFLSVSYTKTQISSNFTAESDKIKHNWKGLSGLVYLFRISMHIT